jgi:hypothetical protein
LNTNSQWRRAIAERLSAPYAQNAKVAAIILGGSVARGHADRFSDIELGVFWHEPPTDTDRQTAFQQQGVDLVSMYPYAAAESVWEDDLMIGRAAPDLRNSGVLVEVVHYTTAFIEQTLEAVLVHYDPSEVRQNLIAGLLDGIPLYGESLVAGWKVRARDYPPELAVAVIRRHAQIDHFWRWEMYLARSENRMMIAAQYVQVSQRLLHMLLALNQRYYGGFKWYAVLAQNFTIAPVDLAARLQHVFTGDPAEGARELSQLVEETYDLLEQHMPQIDVDRLRRIFQYQRPIWDSRPPFTSF